MSPLLLLTAAAAGWGLYRYSRTVSSLEFAAAGFRVTSVSLNEIKGAVKLRVTNATFNKVGVSELIAKISTRTGETTETVGLVYQPQAIEVGPGVSELDLPVTIQVAPLTRAFAYLTANKLQANFNVTGEVRVGLLTKAIAFTLNLDVMSALTGGKS